MNELNIHLKDANELKKLGKFEHPEFTAKGELRASVKLTNLNTLWINTGTLCNIECFNCYIESSPKNDRLVYITAAEHEGVLEEVKQLHLNTKEIAYTGGEPFLNPDMIAMAHQSLARGFEVLILTNAMQPMQRKAVKKGLLELQQSYGEKLTLRVSLDHFSKELHEKERGPNSWNKTIEGVDWLVDHDFNVAIAGRTCWEESEEEARIGFAELFSDRNWELSASNPAQLVLFPEMDETVDVPEITTDCWDILNVNPDDIMCATSRMVVKRKGHDRLTVLPCTLLPYDEAFDMGSNLGQSLRANGGMFDDGAVKLCHHNCAKFCVLGGGSCSA
ncbi:MAG: radical SAM protein [Methyloligellaceae bacterium]